MGTAYRRAKIAALERVTARHLIVYTVTDNISPPNLDVLIHARAVKIPDLVALGVKVSDIRTNSAFYAAVDELYCCLDIFLGNSPVCKIFENSAGDALIRQSGFIQAQLVQAASPPTGVTTSSARPQSS